MDLDRTVLVIRVPKRKGNDVTSGVWTAILKQWIVVAVTGAVAWAVARGMVPAEYTTTVLASSAGAAALIASGYLTARGKLEAAALAQLPAGASFAEVELKMLAIGYARLLGLRGRDVLSADVATMKAQIAKLEAWAAAIDKAKQGRAANPTDVVAVAEP